MYNMKHILLLLEKLKNNVMIDQNIEGQREDQELPLFNLATIVATTNNFSSNNMLGEGGFGPVYKVTLTHFYKDHRKKISSYSTSK
jgi:hypothetical protein